MRSLSSYARENRSRHYRTPKTPNQLLRHHPWLPNQLPRYRLPVRMALLRPLQVPPTTASRRGYARERGSSFWQGMFRSKHLINLPQFPNRPSNPLPWHPNHPQANLHLFPHLRNLQPSSPHPPSHRENHAPCLHLGLAPLKICPCRHHPATRIRVHLPA